MRIAPQPRQTSVGMQLIGINNDEERQASGGKANSLADSSSIRRQCHNLDRAAGVYPPLDKASVILQESLGPQPPLAQSHHAPPYIHCRSGDIAVRGSCAVGPCRWPMSTTSSSG
jgi:hypothetical protein